MELDFFLDGCSKNIQISWKSFQW